MVYRRRGVQFLMCINKQSLLATSSRRWYVEQHLRRKREAQQTVHGVRRRILSAGILGYRRIGGVNRLRSDEDYDHRLRYQ